MFESFKRHISFGYVLCSIASALVLAIAFSFGEALRVDGYIDDPVATAWFLLVYLIAFFIVIVFICELIALFNDGRRTRSKNARNLRREALATRRSAERASCDAVADRARLDREREEFERTGKIPAISLHPEARRRQESLASRLTPRLTPKSIALFALVMCVCWIPYMVAMYPGSMNWDTFYQISMYQETFPVYVIPWIDTQSIVDVWLSDHHPVFDTLLYGVFAKTSLDLTGTWHVGVFVFCLIQCYLTCAVFSAAVAYLRHVEAPVPLRIGIYLFFLLMPFFPMYGMTMLKDSTNALVFVPYFLMFVEAVRTKGAFLRENRTAAIWFLVLAILVVLTKKTGVYVVVPTCIVCAIVFRGAWKHFVVQAASVGVLMWVILPIIVFPLANIIPGGTQEPLNWMFQQTARYVVLYGDEVTADERAAIDAVIDYDKLESEYVFNDSDTVKAWYRYDTVTTSDLLGYIATWAEMGLKHPEVYFQSIVCTASPFFNAHGVMGVHGQTGDGVATEAEEYIWQPSQLQLNLYRNSVFNTYQALVDSPVTALLFRVGPYAAWIPLIAMCYLARRREKQALIMMPVILILASCLFTPIFHARYALSIIYVAPVIVGLLFSRRIASTRKSSK